MTICELSSIIMSTLKGAQSTTFGSKNLLKRVHAYMLWPLMTICELSSITMSTLKGAQSNQGLDSNELCLHKANQFHDHFLNGCCNCKICLRLFLYIEDTTLEV
jgi:hypothetical protein